MHIKDQGYEHKFKISWHYSDDPCRHIQNIFGYKAATTTNLLLSPLVLTDAEFECLFPEVALTQSFHINYH